MGRLSSDRTRFLAGSVCVQAPGPAATATPRPATWMTRPCSPSVTVTMAMLGTGMTSIGAEMSVHVSSCVFLSFTTKLFLSVGATFVLTISMVTLSCLEACASLVTAPTTGTAQPRATVTLTPGSASSVCSTLRALSARGAWRDTLETRSAVSAVSAPVMCSELILKSMSLIKTSSFGISELLSFSAFPVIGRQESVIVFQMLSETTALNARKITGKLQVERVVMPVLAILLVIISKIYLKKMYILMDAFSRIQWGELQSVHRAV